MTLEENITQYKDNPTWELKNIKKDLEMLGGFLNTDEDNRRLEAVKIILKGRASRAKQ
jgi:hypothetical protein